MELVDILSLSSFIILTFVYCIKLKSRMTFAIFNDDKSLAELKKFEHYSLAGYFALVIISQISLNVMSMYFKCGGDFIDSLTNATSLTILPWSLIFGVVIITILIFPGFKSAFSDVIGYYWVSSSANKIITDLLISQEVQPNIDADSSLDTNAKQQMQGAADAIIKICGNSAVLINQMTPRNFDDFWKMLTPLMKQQYKPVNGTISEDTKEKQKQLFELVVSKDNVGEAIWYTYTGLLVTSIVQLNISSRSCTSSVKTMEANAEKYKEQQAKAQEEISAVTSQVYTI